MQGGLRQRAIESVDGRTNGGINKTLRPTSWKDNIMRGKSTSIVYIPWVEKRRQVKWGRERNTAQVEKYMYNNEVWKDQVNS